MQHSASATATPPSATSCAERSAPDADRLADRGVQRAQLAEVGGRQRALERLAAQLGQLRADRATAPTTRGDQRHGVALGARSRAGRRAPASGSSPTMPTTGVG